MKEYSLGNILRGNGETFFYEKKFGLTLIPLVYLQIGFFVRPYEAKTKINFLENWWSGNKR